MQTTAMVQQRAITFVVRRKATSQKAGKKKKVNSYLWGVLTAYCTVRAAASTHGTHSPL
jgi:hypothetical protein